MVCPEIGHFFLPPFSSQLLKSSDIRIFRFRFGSFGLDFFHPNKAIPKMRLFWWPIFSQNVLNFIIAFFTPLPLQKYHFGCKRGEKSSRQFAWTFLYFSSACAWIVYIWVVQTPSRSRNRMHQVYTASHVILKSIALGLEIYGGRLGLITFKSS